MAGVDNRRPQNLAPRLVGSRMMKTFQHGLMIAFNQVLFWGHILAQSGCQIVEVG
jgi:hypothetical protein